MLDSPLVQIALGLILVFALFSLLVSSLQEIGVALFKSRGAALWDSIEMLLGGGEGAQAARQRVYSHPLIRSIVPPSSWSRAKPGIGRRTGPSYIAANVFAQALLDVLREPHTELARLEADLKGGLADLRAGDASAAARLAGKIQLALQMLPADAPAASDLRARLLFLQKRLAEPGAPEHYVAAVNAFLGVLPDYWKEALTQSAGAISSELAGALKTLAGNTAGGIEDVRAAIERWFDQAMASVSGWYKRWTMAVQLGIGLVLALTLNIDTVNIIRELSVNDALRRSLAVQAEVYAARAGSGGAPANDGGSAPAPAQVRQALMTTGVPMGWPDGGLYPAQRASTGAALLSLVGWFLTAIAGSLGAPFWFDLLKKVANVRASGPSPADRTGAAR
ncbi:MAG: hypothetical protein AB7O32_04765 [Vicinamibacterales bacterium]